MKYAVFLLSALLVSGCGASALQQHAGAAQYVRVLSDEVAMTTEDSCRLRAEAILAAELTTDVAEAQLAQLQGRCHGVEVAHKVFVAGYQLWVDQLVRSVADDHFDAPRAVQLVRRLFVTLWPPVTEALRALGVSVPSLPPAVRLLLGGTL